MRRSTITRAARHLPTVNGDDDVGDSAVLFERCRMTDERHGLALNGADAAEAVAAEAAFVARHADIAFVAVGKQPIVGAVACCRRRWEDEIAALGAKRCRATLALDQHIRPVPLRREPKPCRGNHEAELAEPSVPEAHPDHAEYDQHERST